MTMRELLLNCNNEEYQLIHECAISARTIKANAKTNTPAHVRLEIGTQRYTVKQLLSPSSGSYIGVIVWIPTAEYQRLAKGEY